MNKEEWLAVVAISLPIIFIDEVLKLVSRWRLSKAIGAARAADLKETARAKKLY